MSKTIVLNWQEQVYEETIEGNLELSNITPQEARAALGRAVGRYAFYGAVMADAIKLQSKVQMQYDRWYYERYRPISEEAPKGSTETYKKAQVYLENKDEYESWQTKLRNVQNVIDKADILRSAFKLQVNGLQSILYSLKSEIEMAHGGGYAKGARDLRDDVEDFKG